MMNRDRLIQVAAVVAALVCLVGAASLAPRINEQRVELQLTFDLDVGDRELPRYTIATAALGSFRGLAVDALWYRAEQLKQEGKYFEANTLAEAITTLQPRFPEVWRFHAWNMAYNISVLTHTPEERWEWVNKGVRLLRERGIPNNPHSVLLHHELGWIFFHKFGRVSDDAHWYYKLRLAEEWQEVLGVPGAGFRGDDAVEAFAPIAEAADRYLQLERLSRPTRERLEELAGANPEFAEALEGLGERNVVRFQQRVPRVQAQMEQAGSHALARELEPLRYRAQERLERAMQDPLRLLRAEHPEVEPLLSAIGSLGYELGEALTRDAGQAELYMRHVPMSMLLDEERPVARLSEQQRGLLELMDNADYAAGWEVLTPFLRARLLIEGYHMDPQIMYAMMERYGPIDWRHPAAHGAYWASQGLELMRDQGQAGAIDILNTHRLVVHGLQSLMHEGRVNYNLFTRSLDLLPEPAMIESYQLAVEEARGRAEALGREGAMAGFDSGSENFLLRSIQFAYLYGEREQAEELYQEVRERYGDSAYNIREGRYRQPLDDLVMEMVEENFDQIEVVRQFIDSMLRQALVRGLAEGDAALFNRLTDVAHRAYERHQEERWEGAVEMTRERLQLPSTFRETLVESYVNYMQSQQVHMLDKARVYQNTPSSLRRQAFPQVRTTLHAWAEQAGFDPERMFPTPEGLEDLEITAEDGLDVPGTIERQ